MCVCAWGVCVHGSSQVQVENQVRVSSGHNQLGNNPNDDPNPNLKNLNPNLKSPITFWLIEPLTSECLECEWIVLS